MLKLTTFHRGVQVMLGVIIIINVKKQLFIDNVNSDRSKTANTAQLHCLTVSVMLSNILISPFW